MYGYVEAVHEFVVVVVVVILGRLRNEGLCTPRTGPVLKMENGVLTILDFPPLSGKGMNDNYSINAVVPLRLLHSEDDKTNEDKVVDDYERERRRRIEDDGGFSLAD